MKVVYNKEDSLGVKEFAVDWVAAIGIELLAKKYVPEGKDFWYVSDIELEQLKGVPVEAWEVSGQPDGVGGLTEVDEIEFKRAYNKWVGIPEPKEEPNDNSKQAEITDGTISGGAIGEEQAARIDSRQDQSGSMVCDDTGPTESMGELPASAP